MKKILLLMILISSPLAIQASVHDKKKKEVLLKPISSTDLARIIIIPTILPLTIFPVIAEHPTTVKALADAIHTATFSTPAPIRPRTPKVKGSKKLSAAKSHNPAHKHPQTARPRGNFTHGKARK